MGVDGDVRSDVLEPASPGSFYPQRQPKTGEFAYPDLSQFDAFICDLNSLIRSIQLIYPGCRDPKPWYPRQWGQVFAYVGNEYYKRFAAGLREGRVTIDCNSPPNKGKAQAVRGQAVSNRRKAALNGKSAAGSGKRARVVDENGDPVRTSATIEEEAAAEEESDPKADYYKWPANEDGSTWFLHDTPIQCSWEEIFYSDDPRPKRCFNEALTRFLCEELYIPLGCSLLLDCGVRNGVWDRRPVRVELHHPFKGDSITDEELREAIGAGLVTRRIYYDPHQPEPMGYGEADDRMMYHVYDLTVRLRKSVLVFSGDGDTGIALPVTFGVRRFLQRHGPPELRFARGERLPIVMHVMRRSRKLTLPDGRKHDVCDTIVCNTDHLATFIDTHFGGAIIKSQGNAPRPCYAEPAALFALLVAIRPTDYTEGYPFLSIGNLFEAFERHGEVLCAGFSTPSCEYREVLGPYRFLDCRLDVNAFVRFITLATGVARANKSYQCREPSVEVTTSEAARKRGEKPTDKDRIMTIQNVRAMAHRVIWLVDKWVNGGLPGYELPDPFARHPESGKSLYGYEWVPSKKDPNKREVLFTQEVHDRPVAHIVR